MFAIKQQPSLSFLSLHTAYRRFDPVRGMDYQLHLNFYDRNSNSRTLKRFVHLVNILFSCCGLLLFFNGDFCVKVLVNALPAIIG